MLIRSPFPDLGDNGTCRRWFMQENRFCFCVESEGYQVNFVPWLSPLLRTLKHESQGLDSQRLESPHTTIYICF